MQVGKRTDARSDERGLSGVRAASRADELAAIARAASAGDAAAVEMLMREVGGSMRRAVRKVLGHGHPDVEDVIQDALLALLAGLRDFRGDCSVHYFANRIALLTAISARRRLTTRGRFDAGALSLEQAIDERAPSPFAAILSERRRELLLGLLAKLPRRTVEALMLHFVLGYTVEEIAEAGGVSEHTVWSRLRLGKRALRRGLTNDRRLKELFAGQRS